MTSEEEGEGREEVGGGSGEGGGGRRKEVGGWEDGGGGDCPIDVGYFSVIWINHTVHSLSSPDLYSANSRIFTREAKTGSG